MKTCYRFPFLSTNDHLFCHRLPSLFYFASFLLWSLFSVPVVSNRLPIAQLIMRTTSAPKLHSVIQIMEFSSIQDVKTMLIYFNSLIYSLN